MTAYVIQVHGRCRDDRIRFMTGGVSVDGATGTSGAVMRSARAPDAATSAPRSSCSSPSSRCTATRSSRS